MHLKLLYSHSPGQTAAPRACAARRRPESDRTGTQPPQLPLLSALSLPASTQPLVPEP